MRPKGQVINVTSSEDSTVMGRIQGVYIKNQGSTDCQIEPDVAISADSYLLEAGETLWIGYPFVKLFHKTASGTSSDTKLAVTHTSSGGYMDLSSGHW